MADYTKNQALRSRGSVDSEPATNMALRRRGTAVQDDPTPTRLGQGGIGSDTVADNIGAPTNAALRARGTTGYAKGGLVKKKPAPAVNRYAKKRK